MHIIGHQTQREHLRRLREGKTPPQAYLFSGPRGIGKSLCALEFASALAGEVRFEPTAERSSPYDVMILRPETETKRGVTKTKKIASETVRAARVFLSQYPERGHYRVLLIEDAHQLSETAQNVLLKTLEEPPSSAVILLVTHEVGSILPTVLSRVKRLRFGFVPEEELRQGIALSFHEKETATIAPFFFGLGRPGMVLAALRDQEGFVSDREFLSALFRLSTLTSTERMALAEKLALHSEKTIRILEWWLPGLHQQAIRLTDRQASTRFFALLSEVENTVHLIKTTQSNTRLLLEKLFFSV